MSKRKIADCVNIRIKVGDFQHIEIVKYAEEEIEYTSKEDRIQQEDALTESLVDSVLRSLKAIPERLGKGRAEAIEVEQSISKAIPAWLASDPVPNIANNAKKTASTEIDKQMKDKEKALAAEKAVMGDDSSCFKKKPEVKDPIKDFVKAVEVADKAVEDFKKSATTVSKVIADDDLFENDSVTAVVPVKEIKNEQVKVEKKEVKKTEVDEFDMFSDSDDLFGDK